MNNNSASTKSKRKTVLFWKDIITYLIFNEFSIQWDHLWDDLLEYGVPPEAVVQRCFLKKLFLKFSQNSQGNTCARASFLIKLHGSACSFIKKETLAQAFSCEFCEIFKSIFLIEHLRWRLLEYLAVFQIP